MAERNSTGTDNVYARQRRSGKIHLLNNFNRPRCRCSTFDVTTHPGEWDILTTEEISKVDFDNLCGVCAKPQQQPAAMRSARNMERFLDGLTEESKRGRSQFGVRATRGRSIYEN